MMHTTRILEIWLIKIHTSYYMANTDLGNGQALPEYQKQERIPTRVKKEDC